MSITGIIMKGLTLITTWSVVHVLWLVCKCVFDPNNLVSIYGYKCKKATFYGFALVSNNESFVASLSWNHYFVINKIQ